MRRYRYQIAVAASLILGIVFIVSGLGKLLEQNATFINILQLPAITPVLAVIIANVLPWIELLLGLLLVTGICVKFAATASYALIAGFIYYNSWMLMNGMGYESCECFGIFDKFILGELSTLDSLYIDIGLFALALIIYISYPGGFFRMRPWFVKEK